jgi:endogenous inhibitor of DNA gyrase (YacG/DUF329 family)
MGTIDLNRWHHAVHQVSGAMALRFNKATPADLAEWAEMLRKIATEMEQEANAEEVAGG